MRFKPTFCRACHHETMPQAIPWTWGCDARVTTGTVDSCRESLHKSGRGSGWISLNRANPSMLP